jgi:hypothetical protein
MGRKKEISRITEKWKNKREKEKDMRLRRLQRGRKLEWVRKIGKIRKTGSEIKIEKNRKIGSDRKIGRGGQSKMSYGARRYKNNSQRSYLLHIPRHM